ncbi:MAG: 3-hydroxyacyl-CoA dehydrogenase NAD-binding domain-containing protein [Oligoflexia bacterium]|nr:3-hydroxyacyl-CoA dehydrogenase NAD-binding domain-containing protein [Oligoflexia bacterium]
MNTKNFKLFDRGDSWYELCFDQPDSKANVFTEEALRELDSVTEELSKRKDIIGLVVTSAKKDIYIAGADINLIKDLDTIDKALTACSAGQQMIHRFSKLPFETVAAISGACLGGGFELALACKKRVASDARAVKIGLPEVMLGILPGFGGSTRLPRLVPLPTALDLILSGKQVDGKRAFKMGIVDAFLPEQDFNERAIAWAKQNINRSGRNVHTFMTRLMEMVPLRGVVFSQARKQVMKTTKGKYPAPLKILDLLAEIHGLQMDEALKREAKAFSQLAVTPISKRLIEIFQLTEGVKKTNGVSDEVKATKVERAGLLGAGVMGGGIAWAFANKDIPVRMKDLNWDGIRLGYEQAGENFGFALKKRKLTKPQFLGKMGMISGSLDYSGFRNVDVVVEAVVENMDVKKKVMAETEKYISENCILASNTSSLSITEMQSAVSRPQNVGGLHFFNPVSRMPLVEVIAGEKTSKETVATLFELSKKLGKTPIVVKDGPGFLVNRLLLPYMNEALFLYEEGVSIERIDQVMLDFGMPMGPMRLVDEVGIDVAAKVAKILNQAFGARAEASPVSEEIVKSGRLGKKNGKGFYKYENGKPTAVDESIDALVKSRTTKSARLSDLDLVKRMTYPMINEAALALAEGVVATPGEVDLGMIFGTGFAPFRGGLLRYADSEVPQQVAEALEKFSQAGGGERLAPNQALREIARKGFFYSGR